MTITLSLEKATEIATGVLVGAGTSPDNARHVADNVVAAEAAGVASHGLTWIPAFADHVASGKVDGTAAAIVSRSSPAGIKVDARGGFAQSAIAAGTAALLPLARETGIAAMAVTHSGNCLMAGHYVGRMAEAGLVALAFVNSPKSMAPWGGTRPVFGTNPMAFACPRGDDPPMVLDFSSSKVARSEIRLAGQEGRDIPLGWALDAEGTPTTDPDAAMAGSVLPFGEHKGYGIALMIDLMAAAMTGANPSHRAAPFLGADQTPPGTGQFFIAIDPGQFAGDGFAATVSQLFAVIAEQPGVQLPGDRRLAARRRTAAEGIELKKALYDDLMSRLESRGIPVIPSP